MDDRLVLDANAGAGSPATLAEIRTGAYYDSVVLMQLQRALSALPGVLDAGVVMGTPANKELLLHTNLLTGEVEQAAPEDLILIVKAQSIQIARDALAKVDKLLSARRSQQGQGYRPKTLAAATRMAPQANWVLVSVPGRYAAAVAREALERGKNVFLYSDNVELEDELSLKKCATENGLLMMGPDCGTARIDDVGLGFANRVRRGRIGIVAASGTGLQTVMAAIHRLGGGISQAYGTGGRDLTADVQAITSRYCLQRLADDDATDTIVVVSKPPAASVAQALLAAAARCAKPVVVNFIGYKRVHGDDELPAGFRFARTLNECAELAVELTYSAGAAGKGNSQASPTPAPEPAERPLALAQPLTCLRGLYSGGTLASEALFILQDRLAGLRSNTPLPGGLHLDNTHDRQGHTVIDLGGDEFTQGRLHPMLDNELRVRRLLQEAADPQTGLLLLDVVLGDGAHPDPTEELAPAIAEAIAVATGDGRSLPVVAAVIGTDEDPQGLEKQIERLEEAGAIVFTRHDEAVRAAADLLSDEPKDVTPRNRASPKAVQPSVEETAAHAPFTAINVGLESFSDSLRAQGAEVIQLDWRPPAGGDEKMADLLARLR